MQIRHTHFRLFANNKIKPISLDQPIRCGLHRFFRMIILPLPADFCVAMHMALRYRWITIINCVIRQDDTLLRSRIGF